MVFHIRRFDLPVEACQLGLLAAWFLAEAVTSSWVGWGAISGVLLGLCALVPGVIFLFMLRQALTPWRIRLTADRAYLLGPRRRVFASWVQLATGSGEKSPELVAGSVEKFLGEARDAIGGRAQTLLLEGLVMRALRFYCQNPSARFELADAARARKRRAEFVKEEEVMAANEAEHSRHVWESEEMRRGKEWPSHWPRS